MCLPLGCHEHDENLVERAISARTHRSTGPHALLNGSSHGARKAIGVLVTAAGVPFLPTVSAFMHGHAGMVCGSSPRFPITNERIESKISHFGQNMRHLLRIRKSCNSLRLYSWHVMYDLKTKFGKKCDIHDGLFVSKKKFSSRLMAKTTEIQPSFTMFERR